MVTILGKVKLKSKEELIVKSIEPPEKKYREKLMRFLEHKGDSSRRDINQRLRGDYTRFCIDRYFIGEIEEKIVSQVWYGLPRKGVKIGEFGHVYTEPEHRKKGIVNSLMKFLVEDFQRSRGESLLCSTITPWIANIYRKYGFQLMEDKSDCGPMALIKSNSAKNFGELEKKYFEPGLEINIRVGNPGDQFGCRKFLKYSSGLKRISKTWHQVFISSQVSDFREALFRMEDKKGVVTIAENSKGNRVGYVFILSFGSSLEEKAKVLDFVIHPNYKEKITQFLKETIEIGREKGIDNIWSYVLASDKRKLISLLEVGFQEKAILPNYCFLNDKYVNLKILYHTGSSK